MPAPLIASKRLLVFLGGLKSGDEWSWSDGSSWDHEQWAPDQPTVEESLHLDYLQMMSGHPLNNWRNGPAGIVTLDIYGYICQNNISSNQQQNTTTTTTTTTAPTTTITRECEGGGSYFDQTQKCYKVFNEKLNWTEARYFCENVGGELASVSDERTNQFLSNLTPNLAWIGGYYKVDETCETCSGWSWSHGFPWTYDNWLDMNPYHSDAKFSIFNYRIPGKWHPEPESIKAPFICQTSRNNYKFAINQLEKLVNVFSSLLNTTVRTSSSRTGRSLDLELCLTIKGLWKKFAELKDGPTLSFPKILVSSLLDDDTLNTLEMKKTNNFDISECGLSDPQIHFIKSSINKISDYIEIKKFDDETDVWTEENDTCIITEGSGDSSSRTRF